MTKITSLADLRRESEELKRRIDLREKSEHTENLIQVKVAMATCGIASGAREIHEFLTIELEKRNIDGNIIKTGDMGYCFAEPTIEVTRPGEAPVVFGNVDKLKADEIIEKFIKNGEYVEGILPVNYQVINQ